MSYRDAAPLFVFPFSNSMQAYLFGNFEEQLAFNVISDDEVIEVLNEVNDITREHTRTSKTLVGLQDEGQRSSFNSSNTTKDKPQFSNHLKSQIACAKRPRTGADPISTSLFFVLVLLPIVAGIVVLSLYSSSVIKGYDFVVNFISVYLPVVLGTVFVTVVHFRNFSTDDKNIKDGKSLQIKEVIDKWNRIKFNTLGLSWTYNKKLDCLGLTVDANLELID